MLFLLSSVADNARHVHCRRQGSFHLRSMTVLGLSSGDDMTVKLGLSSVDDMTVKLGLSSGDGMTVMFGLSSGDGMTVMFGLSSADDMTVMLGLSSGDDNARFVLWRLHNSNALSAHC